jgi:hypothetical protein
MRPIRWVLGATLFLAVSFLAMTPAPAKLLPTIPISPSTTIEVDGNPNSVIPLPNSGRAPQQPGDRGGWMQITLFCLVITAMGAIFVMIAISTSRNTKRKKRDAGLLSS